MKPIPGLLQNTVLRTQTGIYVYSFDSIAAPPAEKEQYIGKRVQTELLLNQRCQTIYPSVQVRIAAGNVYPVSSGEVARHDLKIRSTASTAATSAPLQASASAPPIRIYNAPRETESLCFLHGKYTSYKGEISPEVPNILQRNFRAASPNQKWLTDLTEFVLPASKVYLSPVIDFFDSMVHSWTIGISPNAQLVNNMLEKALATLRPGEHPIIHSGRGCHYRWPDWINWFTTLDFPNLCQGKGVHQTIRLLNDFWDG